MVRDFDHLQTRIYPLGRAGAAGSRFARENKEPWPQLRAKQLPEDRPRETDETRHKRPQPSRHVQWKGAVLLSGAEDQTARAIGAYAKYAFLLSLQKKIINKNRLRPPRGRCGGLWGNRIPGARPHPDGCPFTERECGRICAYFFSSSLYAETQGACVCSSATSMSQLHGS
jgi:hypothetical protein